MTAVVKAIEGPGQALEVECGISTADDVSHYLLEVGDVDAENEEVTHCQGVRDESPEIFCRH